MHFRRQSSNELNDINITPLIDVVFLLLIFFMVTTTFKTERNLVIDLPTAEGQPVAEEGEVVNIVIDRAGRYSINGVSLINEQIDTLRRGIAKAAEGNNQLPVIISADKLTPHEAVVRVMDTAGQLGFTRQRITAQKASAAP